MEFKGIAVIDDSLIFIDIYKTFIGIRFNDSFAHLTNPFYPSRTHF